MSFNPVGTTALPAVLIVEDDAMLAERLFIVLVGEDIAVKTASTLAEARTLMRERYFAVMIIDRKLEDGDGIEICREYRESTKGKSSCVLALSALDTLTHVLEGVEVGVDAYITKESSPQEVLKCVLSALGREAQG